MNPLLTLVVYAALLTWASVIAASAVRSRGHLGLAMGNRDNLPEPTPLAGRAERAARNTLENFVLFAALALAAQAAGRAEAALLGAQLFFWARVAYLPIYWAGIAYVRTAVWGVAVAGLGMMVWALLRG